MKTNSYFRIIFLSALFFTLLIVYSCNENTVTPDNNAEISGILIDEQAMPIPYAILQVFTNGSGIQGLIDKDTSDEEGAFLLSGLPDNFDGLKMRVEHPDFESFEVDLNDVIQGKDKKNLDVKLLHDTVCTGFVELTVLDKNENPLQNVEIRLNRDGKLIRKAKSNEEGYLKFEHVCPGSYWFRLAKDGFKVIEENFDIEANDSLSFPFTMNKVNSEDSCCNGVIYFSVKDSSNNEAIREAKVRLYKNDDKIAEQYTNGDGLTIFKNICEGKYQISFTREGYKGQEFDFEIGCDDTLEIHKYMVSEKEDSCCDGKIYITPKDKETGKIIKGAWVKLWKNGKLFKKKVVENEAVLFEGLCEGKYGIDILAEGYMNIEFEVELGCNETKEISKMLEPEKQDSCCDGVIYFNVKDSSNNEGIREAKVRLYRNDDKIAEQFTNGDGLTIFKNICEGKYQISFTREGYKGQEFNFEIGCDDTLEIHKYMVSEKEDSCCDGKIYIIPKDKETGKIIKGAWVKLWKNGKLFRKKVVENEAVVFEGLCEGKYGIDILAEGYKNIEFEVELGCNETKEISKMLEPEKQDSCCDGVIYFNVKDSSNNEGIREAKVRLYKNDDKIAEQYTNSDGLTIFKNICEGKYQISFTREGYKGQEFNFDVGCDDTLEIHKKMMKENNDTCFTAELFIAVKDDSTHQPIANANVIIKDSEGNVIDEGKTNENGIYDKKNLEAPFKYYVYVSREGYESKVEDIGFEKCVKKELVFKLERK